MTKTMIELKALVQDKMNEVSDKMEELRNDEKAGCVQWSKNTIHTQLQQLGVRFYHLWVIRELIGQTSDDAKLDDACEKKLRDLCVLTETRKMSFVKVHEGDEFVALYKKYKDKKSEVIENAIQRAGLGWKVKNGKMVLVKKN